MTAHGMDLIEAIRRLGLALALGSAIGFERQWNQKIAGLRINALVALGAWVLSISRQSPVTATRVAAQLVSDGRRRTGSLSGDSGGRSTNLVSLRSSSRC